MKASVREAAAKTSSVCDSGLDVAVGGTSVGARVGASVTGTGVGAAEAPQAVKKMEGKRVRDNKRFMDSPQWNFLSEYSLSEYIAKRFVTTSDFQESFSNDFAIDVTLFRTTLTYPLCEHRTRAHKV